MNMVNNNQINADEFVSKSIDMEGSPLAYILTPNKFFH